jgi:hypothetical protein
VIAMLVLATGLGSLTISFVGCMATDNRNGKDASATLLAQKVIEELSAQNTNSTVAVTLTDCAGNTWTIPSAGAGNTSDQQLPLVWHQCCFAVQMGSGDLEAEQFGAELFG